MWMKSYDVTIQMKPLCLYFHVMLFVFQHFTKFGNLVEICLWLHLAVKGLILQSQSKSECPGLMMEYNDMGVLNFEFSDETLWTASFQINSLRSILTWHYLFLSKCYNKIWIFCWMLTIASFGSLMVNQYYGKLSPQVIIYVICMLIRHTRKPG